MRRTLLGVLVFCLPACGLDVVEIEIVETGTIGGLAISLPGMSSFGSAVGRAISAKEVDPADVDSLRAIGVSLAITSAGQTTDFTFLEKVAFVVSATGLAPGEVDARDTFPVAQAKVDLNVRDLELKPYLDTGAMSIQVQGQIKAPPPDQVTFEVRFRLRVDVNVL